MRAADPLRTSWGRAYVLALGLLLLVALGLRLWGHRHGLPYVFNADENAHFVPRAIGMFDHSYNPGYFINPPAYTYLLHAVFWLRWGGDGVQAALAADPGSVYALARVVTAVLGAAAVGALAWAGSRLLDRRTGLVAAALLAVAFLPVHYSRFALNDVPTLLPVCLALAGAAGVYRRGAVGDYVLAGAALGLASATKYTAGIVLLVVVAAAAVGPRHPRRLVLAGAVAAAAFLLANPYALLDIREFKAGLTEQASASSDGGGKLGLAYDNGIVYYLQTVGWGLGILPALAALGGAAWALWRDRRLAAVLVPAPVVFLLFMGLQDRFFARWLLPVYPILCLLAAYGAVRALDALADRRAPRLGRAWPAAVAAVLLSAQGVVYSVHNARVSSRADTRALAREWMVENIPAGTKVVIEPIAPDQWAADPGRPSRATGNGNRWNKWHTSRSGGRRIKLEDYVRTLRPDLVGSYSRGGFCWVVTGSTQYGRGFAEPEEVPQALRYYRELERAGELVFHVRPYDRTVPFSFDDSFNHRPLAYERPGPEIRIYRLTRNACA